MGSRSTRTNRANARRTYHLDARSSDVRTAAALDFDRRRMRLMRRRKLMLTSGLAANTGTARRLLMAMPLILAAWIGLELASQLAGFSLSAMLLMPFHVASAA